MSNKTNYISSSAVSVAVKGLFRTSSGLRRVNCAGVRPCSSAFALYAFALRHPAIGRSLNVLIEPGSV